VFRVNHYSLDLPHVSRQLERLTGYDMDLVRRHQSRLSGLQARVIP
jgi:lipopolysaccharide biosynthesis protein